MSEREKYFHQGEQADPEVSENEARAQAVQLLRQGKINEGIDIFFRIKKIQPEYVQANSPDFAKNREALKTQPGLIIANHPGMFDAPQILRAIDRNDIKIVTGDDAMDNYGKYFPDKLIPASGGPMHLRKILRTVQETAQAGGVVLIFPTGGFERGKNDEEVFQKGFRLMLDQLQPDDMVYTFYLSPEDNDKAKNLDRDMSQPQVMRVDEKYTTVQEWKDKLKDLDPETDPDKVLTDYYRQLYGVETLDYAQEKSLQK